MSEQHKPQENKESLNPIPDSKEQIENIKSKLEKGVESSEKKTSKELHETRKTIESQAISGKESQRENSEKKSSQTAITKAEKTRTYYRTMKRMQNQLPATSRSFSKFIHSPVVEKSSAVVGNTVARPSGILGAGIIGFVGISFIMYYASRNGFEISNNYTLIIILFVGGWVIGLLIELLLKVLRQF